MTKLGQCNMVAAMEACIGRDFEFFRSSKHLPCQTASVPDPGAGRARSLLGSERASAGAERLKNALAAKHERVFNWILHTRQCIPETEERARCEARARLHNWITRQCIPETEAAVIKQFYTEKNMTFKWKKKAIGAVCHRNISL